MRFSIRKSEKCHLINGLAKPIEGAPKKIKKPVCPHAKKVIPQSNQNLTTVQIFVKINTEWSGTESRYQLLDVIFRVPPTHPSPTAFSAICASLHRWLKKTNISNKHKRKQSHLERTPPPHCTNHKMIAERHNMCRKRAEFSWRQSMLAILIQASSSE